jgi:hypothetical protein
MLFDSLIQGSRRKKLENPDRRNEKLDLTDAMRHAVLSR